MLRYLKSSALLLNLVIVGCLSPEKLQQKKDPDTVVKFASRRLDGKRLKTTWAKALETAFAQANETDLRRIADLKALGTTTAWEQIHDINEQVERRHQRVEPLLPLVTDDGYRPDIRLLPVADMLAESRREVIERSLPGIEENLRLAGDGQRLQARKAYNRIVSLRKKYRWAGARPDELQATARSLGTVHILLDYDNFGGGYGTFMDYGFGYQSSIGEGFWQSVDRRPEPGVRYDFQVDIDIVSASVSPEYRSTTTSTYSKKVQVGQEAIKDTSGAVIGYNIIYETVSSTVEHTTVTKNASLTAQMLVFDAVTGEQLNCDWIWENDSFTGTFCTVSGDARAGNDGCSSLGPVAIPSDWQMMENCDDDLRFSLGWRLRNVDLRE